MQKMSVIDLTQYIEKKPDINYIAHVATPMTAIWAKACLYYMHEEMHMNNLNGIFLCVRGQRVNMQSRRSYLLIMRTHLG